MTIKEKAKTRGDKWTNYTDCTKKMEIILLVSSFSTRITLKLNKWYAAVCGRKRKCTKK